MSDALDPKQSPLLLLPGGDQWTIGDSLEGTQIFGAPGSGKTSGSGQAIARAFLRNGFGGLVLSVKSEELVSWIGYAQDEGRLQDFVILGLPDVKREGRFAQAPHLLPLLKSVQLVDSFNFLAYESSRTTREIPLSLDLVRLFLTVVSSGDGRVSATDPYWNDALAELLTHTIDLLDLAGAPVTLQDMCEIVRSAPRRPDEVPEMLERGTSRCVELLAKADGDEAIKGGRLEDLRDTAAYWLQNFPGLSDRTRSVIISSFTAKVASLLRSPLRSLLCAESRQPEAEPEATHSGTIVFVDLPVKEYGEVGRIAQVVIKSVWQRATERRRRVGDWRPVFLWADESQYFVTPADMLFQQTARSAYASTVYLTQNIPNYVAALDRGSSQSTTDSLLGNLQTKIFHANGDPTTNDWASRMFGVGTVEHGGWNMQHTGERSVSGGESTGQVVHSARFTTLRRGGPFVDPLHPDTMKAGAIFFQGGRKWKLTGRSDLPVLFDQSTLEVTANVSHPEADGLFS